MEQSNFFAKVYLWLFIGLMVTFVTGSVVASSPSMLDVVFADGFFLFIIFAELITVIVLSARISKMTPVGAKIGFILYSFLSGLTFSTIFLTYNIDSIMYIFLITALVLLVFSVIGFKTKVDLTGIGTFLIMLLFAIIIGVIINLFIGSSTIDLALCVGSLIIFIIFIAYDVQKIKRLNEAMPDNDNVAIIGALELYLDFINIFINLLKLFGSSRD